MLFVCAGCNRHVRIEEASCPFCGDELPLAPAERGAPKSRLGRAALLALGATVAGACGEDVTQTGSGGTTTTTAQTSTTTGAGGDSSTSSGAGGNGGNAAGGEGGAGGEGAGGDGGTGGDIAPPYGAAP